MTLNHSLKRARLEWRAAEPERLGATRISPLAAAMSSSIHGIWSAFGDYSWNTKEFPL